MAAATFISEHMESLAAIPDQLAQAVRLLESLTSDVQQLKQEQTLSPAQKQHIKEAVQRIVDDSAGQPGALNHAQVYGAIFRHFHVSAYSEISAARSEEVMTVLARPLETSHQGRPARANRLALRAHLPDDDVSEAR
jgi:hypothetical protein